MQGCINVLPLLTFLTLLVLEGEAEAHSQVVTIIEVKNPTHAEEYHCVVEPHCNTSEYRWHRQNGNGLPEGVKAEGNKLHFMKSVPELNGVYICTVVNHIGAAAGSLFRNMQRHEEF